MNHILNAMIRSKRSLMPMKAWQDAIDQSRTDWGTSACESLRNVAAKSARERANSEGMNLLGPFYANVYIVSPNESYNQYIKD